MRDFDELVPVLLNSPLINIPFPIIGKRGFLAGPNTFYAFPAQLGYKGGLFVNNLSFLASDLPYGILPEPEHFITPQALLGSTVPREGSPNKEKRVIVATDHLQDPAMPELREEGVD